MTHFTPIRDLAGRIVGMQPKDERGAFEATLAETMTAVGVPPTAADPPAPRSRYEAGALALGVLLALALIAGLGLGRGAPVANQVAPVAHVTAQEPRRATIAPTSIPSHTPIATMAPTASPLPPTAELPAPVVVEVQCYTVQLTVLDARSYPIGTVEGSSCDSQDDAQASAEALAEQMKASR
jgi:hypothetical protein